MIARRIQGVPLPMMKKVKLFKQNVKTSNLQRIRVLNQKAVKMTNQLFCKSLSISRKRIEQLSLVGPL